VRMFSNRSVIARDPYNTRKIPSRLLYDGTTIVYSIFIRSMKDERSFKYDGTRHARISS